MGRQKQVILRSNNFRIREKSIYLFELPTYPIIMGKAEIEALAKRIEALEAKVGKNHSSPVLPYLVDYSNDLGNSLAGNDRIGPLLKRLDELETYLDPLYGENEMNSAGVKLSLAESQHSLVKENTRVLERLEQLKPSLDLGNMRKMEELEPKMSELSRIQFDQREEAEKLGEETLELVQKYNDIIASLSQAFIEADQVISRAETNINVKKT